GADEARTQRVDVSAGQRRRNDAAARTPDRRRQPAAAAWRVGSRDGRRAVQSCARGAPDSGSLRAVRSRCGRMMRVLIAHSGNMYGGTERTFEALAQAPHLCPALECRFALCFDGPFAETLRSTGTTYDRVGDVRVTRPDLVLRARRRFLSIVKDYAPDVV